ncbi:MAG: response regulator [Chryseolinea sp.]
MTRILIVDDTKVLADNIADTLKMEGYSISVAYNGIEATLLFKRDRPALIITDLEMPEMNGYDFIRFVRSGNIEPLTPIIIITADTNDETASKGIAAGADLFLTKPFDDENLILSIINLLENVQHR